MAAVIAQMSNSAAISLSTTPQNISFGDATTAGNTIVVAIAVGSTSATVGASDGTNGTYTLAVQNSGFNSAGILVFYAAASVTTIQVTSSVTGTGVVWLFEVSGLDVAATRVTGTMTNTSSTDSFSSSTELSGEGFSVCASQAGSNLTHTAGTGWTQASTPSLSRFSQYRTDALTNNRGPFDNGGLPGNACMAIFPMAGDRVYADRDITQGNWTASTGSDLYAMLAEESGHIFSHDDPAATTAEVGLPPLDTPTGTVTIHIRHRLGS